MALIAMAEFWSDSVAIASLLLTAVGFIVTLLSLYHAIRQVKAAKSAAEAAREAATAALQESRRNYVRYIAANCHRFTNEAIIHVGNKAWHFAALRLDDLADQMALLTAIDAQCKQLADELRIWSSLVKRLAAGDISRWSANRWANLLLRLRAKIDAYHHPFLTHQPE